MSKRIVLLLDGTWNDADDGAADTNVVRLREIIAKCLETSKSEYPFDEIKIAELKRVTFLKLLFVSICVVQVAASLALFLLKLYHSFPWH